MKRKVLCTLVGLAVFFSYAIDAETRQNKGTKPVSQDKLRVIILTDIGGDPDDEESMVRFLTYCNEFDVEGLIATDRCPRDERPQVLPGKIIERVKAYGQIRDNLLLHAQGYPTVEYLLARVKAGNWDPGKRKWLPKVGRTSYISLEARIGPDKGSEASNWIIEVVDRPDKRPVLICIWGGSSDLAQALWQVRKTRSFAEVVKFVSKIRVYAIVDQDTTAAWIRDNFPDIHYIRTRYPYGAHQGMYKEGETSLYNEKWVKKNVLNGHGPLGKLYSRRPWRLPYAEGDTSSILYLIPTGLGNQFRPWLGCWGGRFQKLGPRPFFLDAEDHNPNSWDAGARRHWAVARWRRAFQNDFEARMDWCVKPFDQANHNPIAALNGEVSKKIVERTAKHGAKVKLNADGSSDPDGDKLSYRWFVYKEAGDYPNEITIENADAKEATVLIPDDAIGREIHVILEVTDNGKPVLYSYRRVIFRVK
jgi:cellulose-binding protein